MSVPRVSPIDPRERLARAVAETPAGAARATRFRILRDVELEQIPDKEHIIAGIAMANSLLVLIGAYGTFKTFLLLEMAFCLAVGCEWHGRRVQQGAVLYIYAEGTWGARKRLAAVKRAYEFTGSAPLYFLPTAVMLTEPAQVALLVAAIDAIGVPFVAVVVDTVARNMSGDESKVDDMGRFIRGCDTIREATGAAVLLAHHTGWAAERSRGSTSLPGAVDTEILVERDGDVVTLKCTKQKDAPEFPPITLEAFPIAESLAFRTRDPRSAELTQNERRALTVAHEHDGLTATTWREAADLGKSSFHNARTRLLALAYVTQKKKLYIATDAGRLALGSRVNIGSTEGHTSQSVVGSRAHTPLGGERDPDPDLLAGFGT